MMLVAFILHPWVAMMKAMSVKPRTLADDLLILAAGPGHEKLFKEAYLATFEYMQLIGARMAPAKCHTLSSNEVTRARLRAYLWQPINAYIPVAVHMRDLGGHLSVGAKMIGSTCSLSVKQKPRI